MEEFTFITHGKSKNDLNRNLLNCINPRQIRCCPKTAGKGQQVIMFNSLS